MSCLLSSQSRLQPAVFVVRLNNVWENRLCVYPDPGPPLSPGAGVGVVGSAAGTGVGVVGSGAGVGAGVGVVGSGSGVGGGGGVKESGSGAGGGGGVIESGFGARSELGVAPGVAPGGGGRLAIDALNDPPERFT
jgi:hypothetical protein